MSSPGPTRAFTAWLSRLVLLILMAPAMVLAATPTTTALSSSTGAAALGQSITLTATVTGASPTGTVTFKDGGAAIGSSAITAGVASVNTSALGLGSHTLSAEYAGDSNNDPSTSSGISVVINAATAGPMTWQYGYDAMGRPTTVLDPNGLATYTYYDSLGRPVQTQQPANTGSATPTTTSFAYNAADGLTQVTDPRSLNTTYTPNGLGNVIAQTSPDTGASQYTYDANGNVLTKTDARGKLSQYTYDNLDRPIRAHYASGTDTVIEYDGGATPIPGAIGALTKITDASGQTVYTYDSLGRRISKTQTTGTRTFTVGYTWGDTGGALDKLTAITYPSGLRVNYSYDAQGVVSGITVNPPNANGVGTNTGSSLPMISGITQNAESKLTGWTWASTRTQAISYDSAGRMVAYNLGDSAGAGAAAGIRRTVVRDNAGRITGYTHVSNGVAVPALDQNFGYDNLNRLISATLGATAIQYSYDATGNRTAKVVSGVSYPNTISATSNRLDQIQDASGTATVVHDAAGNITSDGTNSYTYSDRGRLATMTNAGGTVSYSYNAFELRVGKTGPTALIPSGAAYYVYDESGKLLGEYDVNGIPVHETVYLGGPVGVVKQTGTAAASDIAIELYNVSTDQLGAPRIITRQSNEAIVWRWDTAEPFGATAPDQNPAGLGIFTFNQRLPGQVFDAESGLFQNWNREYNPRIGRYMQSDPIGLEGGINTFTYVGGDPLRMTDPTGLDVFRGPGNQYSDIRPTSGCLKPIWRSGYIMDWQSCDPAPNSAPPACTPDASEPSNSATSPGNGATPATSPKLAGGPASGGASPTGVKPSGATGFPWGMKPETTGRVSFGRIPIGCIHKAQQGPSYYVGCGLVSSSGIEMALNKNIFGDENLAGWGTMLSLGLGPAGVDIFFGANGGYSVDASAGVGLGGNPMSLTFGYKK